MKLTRKQLLKEQEERIDRFIDSEGMKGDEAKKYKKIMADNYKRIPGGAIDVDVKDMEKLDCQTCGKTDQFTVIYDEFGNEIRCVCKCGSYFRIVSDMGVGSFTGKF